MTLYNVIAILVSAAALLSYVNHRFVGLPTTIGLMLIAMLLSIGVIILGQLGVDTVTHQARSLLERIDFSETLMQGMLSFLLFAGALHVNISDLARNKWIIGMLATGGVLLSTVIVGYASWWVFGRFGIEMPLVYCLLFGALISPTDPVAVLGILKTAGAPRSLEAKITGESLFNDGVGIVVFLVLFGIAVEGREPSPAGVAGLLAQEAIGGVVFGLLLGATANYLLKTIDNYQVEVLLSLAVVTGGYAAAQALHISGPIAVVVGGLLVGNRGRRLAMSERTREHLDTFWELVDEVLNAILFMLIGLEVMALLFSAKYAAAGVFLIPVVLLARFISVSLPVTLLRFRREFSADVVKIMTWGGLRGGISVALALSLPAGDERDVILMATYVVVVFSIMVQGLTLSRLVKA